MSSALALVRQVQSLVENPKALAEQGCLGQVISFLECCLKHPDSRSRLGAARALGTLSARCSEEQWSTLELGAVRRLLSGCEEAVASGVADENTATMRRLLAAALERDSRALADEGSGGRDCGEVRVRVPEMDAAARAAVCKAIVCISGAVSVTFERGHIVVSTRTSSIAGSPAFVSDLCATIREQLGEASADCVAPIGSAVKLDDLDGADTCSFPGEPEFLDDSEEDDEGSFIDDDEDDEPLYLDDEEDEEDEGPIKEARAHIPWTFFGQPYWLTAQRIAEFEEDPRIVARLARAREKQERRQREEQSRLRRLLSVITTEPTYVE